MATYRAWGNTMKSVILDANALMMPVQYGVDVEREVKRLLGACEILVPSTVAQEINHLKEQGGKTREAARVAQQLIERFRVVGTNGWGDQSIINLAREVKGIVVTNDKMLRGELRKIKIPVIYLRGNNRLELEGWCE